MVVVVVVAVVVREGVYVWGSPRGWKESLERLLSPRGSSVQR